MGSKSNEIIEKSMHSNHGYSMEGYERSLDKKITVEKKREKEYEKSKEVSREANSQVHK